MSSIHVSVSYFFLLFTFHIFNTYLLTNGFTRFLNRISWNPVIKIVWGIYYWKSIMKYPWVYWLNSMIWERGNWKFCWIYKIKLEKHNFGFRGSMCHIARSVLRFLGLRWLVYSLFLFLLFILYICIDHLKKVYSSWFFARNEKLVHG